MDNKRNLLRTDAQSKGRVASSWSSRKLVSGTAQHLPSSDLPSQDLIRGMIYAERGGAFEEPTRKGKIVPDYRSVADMAVSYTHLTLPTKRIV